MPSLSRNELVFGNLAAAIRETMNAEMVARFEPHPPAKREVPQKVIDSIYEARLLLQIAAEDLQKHLSIEG